LDGWWSIHLILRTFISWLSPPPRTFEYKDVGEGDRSDNSNAAAQLCWKIPQDAWMISLVSEMYFMAVIYLFVERDSFCVAHMFWLLWRISKTSWTLAILGNNLSSACFFNS
jgi:hypothetical protein